MADLDHLLEHATFLERLARSLVVDPHDADDLVQETWTRALRNPPADPSTARAWLARTLRNLRISGWRTDVARTRRERAVAPVAGLEDAGCDLAPDLLLERIDEARRVLDAIGRLDEVSRVTILRRYYEDRTPTEIASLEGIPVDTVKTRLRRARVRLRGDLEERGGKERTARGLALLASATTAVASSGARTASAATSSTATSSGSTSGAVGAGTVEVGTVEVGTVGVGVGAATLTLGGIGAMKVTVMLVAAVVGVWFWGTVEEPRSVGEREAQKSEQAPFSAPSSASSPTLEPDVTTESEGAIRRSSPAELGAVFGRVVRQGGGTAGDGVSGDGVSTEGNPVEGAEVRWEGRVLDARGAPLEDAEGMGRTDAEGRFRIDALLGTAVSRLTVIHDDAIPRVVIRSVPVRERGADYGTIELARGGRVRGRVIDRVSRLPLSDLQVWIAEPGSLPPRWRPIARSDSEGRFETGARFASERSHFLVVATERWYGSAEIARGSAGDLDLEIEADAPGVVEVSVVDARGAAVEGVEIDARPRFAPLSWGMTTSLDARTRRADPRAPMPLRKVTDARGRARFTGLPLQPPPGSGLPSGPYTVFAHVEPEAIGRAAVLSPESTLVEFLLDPGVSVAVTGRIQDEFGDPIEGARVELAGEVAYTEADGVYRFEEFPVETGSLHSVVTKEGYLGGGASLWLPDPPVEWLAMDSTLYRPRVIEGRIVDRMSEPVPHVEVTFHVAGHIRAATSDAEGWFRVENVDARSHAVRINDRDSGWRIPGEAQVRGGDSDVEIVVQRVGGAGGAVLRARLFEGRSGSPITGVRVSLSRSGERSLTFESDDEGCIEGEGLGLGRWTLTVPAEGRPMTREFWVDRDTARIDLEIAVADRSSHATLEIHLEAAGAAASAKRIWLGFGQKRAVWVDARGRVVPGVTGAVAFFAPGVDRVLHIARIEPNVPFEIRAEDHAGRTVVTLAPGEHGVCTLRVGGGGTLRVVAPEDFPQGLRRVEIAREDDPWVNWDLEWMDAPIGDEDRRRRSEGRLPAGRYRWRMTWLPFEGQGAGRTEVSEGEIRIEESKVAELAVP